MDLHFAIDIILILFAIITSSVVTVIVVKKGINVFESGRDRDGTILLFLLFVALFYTLALFADKLTGEVISAVVGGILGAIGTAAAFIYKERQSNGNGKP